MYKIDLVFSLNISLNSIKNFMKDLDMPYPIVENAAKITITIDNLQEVPNKEELQKLVNSSKDALIGIVEEDYTIENARFLYSSCIRK